MNSINPLGLNAHEWGVLAAFIALLLGVSFISPKLAGTIGVAAIIIVAAQGLVSGKLLGSSSTQTQSNET